MSQPAPPSSTSPPPTFIEKPIEKPFSQACENNRQPILAVLQRYLTPNMEGNDGKTPALLEVGSGTGQHAVYFAEQFPWLNWQTSDLPASHPGIRAWIADSGLNNILLPVELNVRENSIKSVYQAVFSANTLHIMAWEDVLSFFPLVAGALEAQGLLFVYGPFNYQGAYTSESNQRFDQWLHNQNNYSGIRDFEAVNRLAAENNLILQEDVAMPANNRTLVFKKEQ